MKEKEASNVTKSQISPWLDEYIDCFTFKTKPVTQAFIDRFSMDLAKWAHSDNNALIVSQFYLKKGIAPQTYYRWVNQHPKLKEAHEIAKLCIGNRRELGALNKKLSEAMVTQRQHFYDGDWETDRLRQKQDKIDIGIAIKKLEKGPEERQFTIVQSCFKDHSDETTEPCEKISYTTCV